jgi:small subunit ribosomal protein S25e
VGRFHEKITICTNLLIACAVKDKSNHAVVLDKGTSEKLQKDVQSYRLITVAVLVDRLKINGSLARAALKDLEEKGVIKKVVAHSSGNIYSEYNSCVHLIELLGTWADFGPQHERSAVEAIRGLNT